MFFSNFIFRFPWRIEIKHVSSHTNNSIHEEIRLLDRNHIDSSRHMPALHRLPAAPHHQHCTGDGSVIDYSRCCRLYPRHQKESGLLVP